ncbi:hypothetical protein N9893_03215 [bacterium]|nr:hypothetical protein [bacterium]
MKKKSNCLIIVFVTFLFLFEICRAEPDSTIQYLMNEPVTMLEWGLFRLEQHLNRTPQGLKVNYYPEINRIRIEHEIGFNNKFKDLYWAKDACKHVFKAIRSLAGSPLIYKHSFHHSMHYRLKNEPKDLDKKLMAITEIYVVAHYGDKNSSVMCTAPLSGNDIFFNE